MVRIAIAGASSEIGREILDALIAKQRHEIVLLSRSDTSRVQDVAGISWVAVDYEDKTQLAQVLKGVHTVLSFIGFSVDAQKNLIDASIVAGVKRFAPSEFASSKIDSIPWYAGRGVIRDYLSEVNKDRKVLEYTLFQPGLFLDYLAYPHNTTKYMTPLNTTFDFEHRRAIVIEGVDITITLTALRDVAAIVAQAIEYEGEWPVTGGICGNTVTFSQILEVGAKVRGLPFSVDSVKLEDLEAGELNVTWPFQVTGPSFLKARFPDHTEEQLTSDMKGILTNLLVSSAKGAWTASNEWNRLLPRYQFAKIEDFLGQVWPQLGVEGA